MVDHRIFQPTSDQPLDFELTVESYLLDLTRRFSVRQILYDPWQMQATAQRLTKARLPLQEFPQNLPNLTQASQCVFDLIESQSIVLYPDQQMRLAVSRAVAIEGPRGWRIGKDKSAFKIDVVVALAMASTPLCKVLVNIITIKIILAGPPKPMRHHDQPLRNPSQW